MKNDKNIEGVCEFIFIDTGKIVRHLGNESPLLSTSVCVDIDLSREIYDRLLAQGLVKTEDVWTKKEF